MNDPNTSIDEKKKLLQTFVDVSEVRLNSDGANMISQQAKDFQTKSTGIQTDLNNLSNEFEQFTAKFKAWGQSKEDVLTGKIAKLDKEISDLNIKIAELKRKATDAANIGAGVAICLGFVCIFAPYAAPLVVVSECTGNNAADRR